VGNADILCIANDTGTDIRNAHAIYGGGGGGGGVEKEEDEREDSRGGNSI